MRHRGSLSASHGGAPMTVQNACHAAGASGATYTWPSAAGKVLANAVGTWLRLAAGASPRSRAEPTWWASAVR